jgi:cysteine desulfurase / selenocysteine lyase
MHSERNQFPILSQTVPTKPLIYFDNAASTQKPLVVIEAISTYYQTYNSNIHRGAHYLANLATERYEAVRDKIADFIHVDRKEVIFTSGTTHSINLLAQAWGRKFLHKGDEIVLTEMEHHANLVPWIALSQELGFVIRYIPMNENCELDLTDIETIINTKTKLVSFAYISNAIGTIHPVEKIVTKAKQVNALVHLDCAQAIQHRVIDVQKLNIDFLSFSSHKMYGPMGVGVFWGKSEHLNAMNPYMYGGEMIKEVFLDKVIYNELPYKYEAGTPNVADVIGLGAAIDYISKLGLDKIEAHEKELQLYLYDKLAAIDQVKIYTPRENSTAVVSFTIENIHNYDIGQLLDSKGIAIRTGSHCCQPLMRKLDIEGTCRASLAFYNTREEVDFFVESIKSIVRIFQ